MTDKEKIERLENTMAHLITRLQLELGLMGVSDLLDMLCCDEDGNVTD